MSRWRPRIHIPNPFPPIPTPHIEVGGTLGNMLGDAQDALNNIKIPVDFNFHNEYFDKLNDEAKKLVGDFEGFVLTVAGGPSKEQLASSLADRVAPKLTADMNQESFNNVFQVEAVGLFREYYTSSGEQTCYFIVAGLMILVAVAFIILQPQTTLFIEGLIGSAFILAAQGCSA
ncbi:MAG: hypothetical protein ACQEW5_02825 [Bacillota bacterium]